MRPPSTHAQEQQQQRMPIFAWLLRHNSFTHNRFFVADQGLAPCEIIQGKRYTGKLLVFGEQCIYYADYAGSRYKGDLQWRQESMNVMVRV